MEQAPERFLRISKSLVESLSKDEFVLLSYLMLEGAKPIRALNKGLGIGVARIIRAGSGLKEKGLVSGKATQPETLELMPLSLPDETQPTCKIPAWVILDIRSRAADKQLLTYYFREGENFDGTLSELAERLGMKKRNANYMLEFLEKKKIIERSHAGQKIRLQLLARPKKGFLESIFGS